MSRLRHIRTKQSGVRGFLVCRWLWGRQGGASSSWLSGILYVYLVLENTLEAIGSQWST